MWLKIFLTIWKLINILLDNPRIKGNIKSEIKNHLERDEKGNILFQNLWDLEKSQTQGKIYGLKAFIIKEENLKIKELNIHHKKLENRKTKKEVQNGN